MKTFVTILLLDKKRSQQSVKVGPAWARPVVGFE